MRPLRRRRFRSSWPSRRRWRRHPYADKPHEVYRAEFPDGTVYIGITAIGIENRWERDHNEEVEERKRQYPDVKPFRVARTTNRYQARQVERTLIRNEVLVLNWKDTRGNSVWDQGRNNSTSSQPGCLESALFLILILALLALFTLGSCSRAHNAARIQHVEVQSSSATACEPVAAASRAGPDHPCE